jgi:hypothetical protein
MSALALTTKSLSRKEILELILAYFLLTEQEQEALETAIYLALRSSMIASYNWQAHWIDITIQYIPTEEQEDYLKALAKLRTQQILETYENDITNAATRILDAFEAANGDLEGVLPELRETLKDYTQARTEQKAQDISQYEVAEGADEGTQSLIDDITDSDEGDNVYVSPEDMDLIMVGVLPEYALTDDECEAWAGQAVPILEVADSGMPVFPLHNHCPHYRTLLDLRDNAA